MQFEIIHINETQDAIEYVVNKNNSNFIFRFTTTALPENISEIKLNEIEKSENNVVKFLWSDETSLTLTKTISGIVSVKEINDFVNDIFLNMNVA